MLTNPHRGQVPLAAGETTYTLSLSINALCALEAHLDRPIVEIILELDAMAANGVRLKLGTLRAVLWATLQDHQPDLGIEKAGEILDAVGVQVAMAQVMAACAAAMPIIAPGKAKKARPPTAGR